MKIKKQVFKDVSEIIPPDAILCTNTSALSVTEMAEASKDPSRVIGFHFFNPVHRMPLVEIIKTARKDDIDLIIMGSHGRTGLPHVLIGSVAERVVRKAHCPVLIVKDKDTKFEMP